MSSAPPTQRLEDARRSRWPRRRRSTICWTATAVSGVRGDGFQTIVSPQTAAIMAFQAQTATGKLNAVMIADRPERVPLLDHPVPGPLAGDRQAVELARQADGEVAHVDHLLDLALALGADLARLEGDQQAQVGLALAQGLRRSGGRPRRAAAAGPSARSGTRRTRGRRRDRSHPASRPAPPAAAARSPGWSGGGPAPSREARRIQRRDAAIELPEPEPTEQVLEHLRTPPRSPVPGRHAGAGVVGGTTPDTTLARPPPARTDPAARPAIVSTERPESATPPCAARAAGPPGHSIRQRPHQPERQAAGPARRCRRRSSVVSLSGNRRRMPSPASPARIPERQARK